MQSHEKVMPKNNHERENDPQNNDLKNSDQLNSSKGSAEEMNQPLKESDFLTKQKSVGPKAKESGQSKVGEKEDDSEQEMKTREFILEEPQKFNFRLQQPSKESEIRESGQSKDEDPEEEKKADRILAEETEAGDFELKSEKDEHRTSDEKFDISASVNQIDDFINSRLRKQPSGIIAEFCREGSPGCFLIGGCFDSIFGTGYAIANSAGASHGLISCCFGSLITCSACTFVPAAAFVGYHCYYGAINPITLPYRLTLNDMLKTNPCWSIMQQMKMLGMTVDSRRTLVSIVAEMKSITPECLQRNTIKEIVKALNKVGIFKTNGTALKPILEYAIRDKSLIEEVFIKPSLSQKKRSSGRG